MAVSATSATDSAGALGALAPTASGADSEQRFLKLLVTQLNNQDPLNPLDNAQLTSQLAQMSTVSGIEKLNSAFQSLLAQSGSSQVLQSAALIGRTVLVAGNDLAFKQGTDTSFAIDMAVPADAVKVTIADGAGKTLRSYDVGALPQGVKTLSWDGKTDSGTLVADGSYTVNVAASSGGKSVAANALTSASVVSVAQGPYGVSLDLGASRKVSLSDVRLIF